MSMPPVIKECKGRRLRSQWGMLPRYVGSQLGSEWMAEFKLTKIGRALLTKGTTWVKGEKCRDGIWISLAYLNKFRWKCWGQLEKGFEGQVRETRIDPAGKRSQCWFFKKEAGSNSSSHGLRSYYDPSASPAFPHLIRTPSLPVLWPCYWWLLKISSPVATLLQCFPRATARKHFSRDRV